jgi:hypothetical protein
MVNQERGVRGREGARRNRVSWNQLQWIIGAILGSEHLVKGFLWVWC